MVRTIDHLVAFIYICVTISIVVETFKNDQNHHHRSSRFIRLKSV